ncbi:MAG: hypothetical protein ACERKV_00165 [Clostridiaceae bacterium]
MKKIVLFFMFSLVLNLAACGKQEIKNDENQFEMKIAYNLVDNYLKYLVVNDQNNLEDLIKIDLKTNLKINDDMKKLGYKYNEITQIGDKGMIGVDVLCSSTEYAYTCIDRYNIKVEKMDNQYKISEINNEEQREAFVENSSIRLRKKSEVETNLVLDKSSIPKYVYSKDDKTVSNMIDVDNITLANISLSYTGEYLLFSAKNEENIYIGLVSIDEFRTTMNETPTGGEEQDMGGSTQSSREIPIGKEMLDIDYLTKATVDKLTFTPNEKLCIVQYKRDDLGESLRVYDASNGDIISFSFEEEFPPEIYNVKFSSYDKKFIYFYVSSIGNTNKNLVGVYKLDVLDYNVTKI